MPSLDPEPMNRLDWTSADQSLCERVGAVEEIDARGGGGTGPGSQSIPRLRPLWCGGALVAIRRWPGDVLAEFQRVALGSLAPVATAGLSVGLVTGSSFTG